MFGSIVRTAIPLAIGYLAVTGSLTNAALVGCGLLRAGKSLCQGEPGQAAIEALAAAASPLLLASRSATDLALEVFAEANDLVAGLCDEPQVETSENVISNGQKVRNSA